MESKLVLWLSLWVIFLHVYSTDLKKVNDESNIVKLSEEKREYAKKMKKYYGTWRYEVYILLLNKPVRKRNSLVPLPLLIIDLILAYITAPLAPGLTFKPFSGQQYLYSTICSKDQSLLFTAGAMKANFTETNVVKIWDTATSQCLRDIYTPWNHSMTIAISQNNKLLAIANPATLFGEKTVSIWNIGNGELKITLAGDLRFSKVCTFMANDQYLLTGWGFVDGGKIIVSCVETGTIMKFLSLGFVSIPEIYCEILNEDHIVVANSIRSNVNLLVHVWNWRTGAVRRCPNNGHRLRSLLSKTGHRLLTITNSGILTSQETLTGRITDLVNIGECSDFDCKRVTLRAVSSDPQTRLVAIQWIRDSVTIDLWDTERQRCIRQITDARRSYNGPNPDFFTEDLQHLIFCDGDEVRIYSTNFDK